MCIRDRDFGTLPRGGVGPRVLGANSSVKGIGALVNRGIGDGDEGLLGGGIDDVEGAGRLGVHPFSVNEQLGGKIGGERTVVGHHETTLRRGVDAMAGFDVHVGRTLPIIESLTGWSHGPFR